MTLILSHFVSALKVKVNQLMHFCHHEICGLVGHTLGQLRFPLKHVPLKPDSPPDKCFAQDNHP